MNAPYREQLEKTLGEIEAAGLFKRERIIATPQRAHIATANGREVLNFCANNYLGLANHPAIIAAAEEGLGTCGGVAFDEAKAKEILGIPADVRVIAMTPLGYPDKASADTGRRPLEELVRYERW